MEKRQGNTSSAEPRRLRYARKSWRRRTAEQPKADEEKLKAPMEVRRIAMSRKRIAMIAAPTLSEARRRIAAIAHTMYKLVRERPVRSCGGGLFTRPLSLFVQSLYIDSAELLCTMYSSSLPACRTCLFVSAECKSRFSRSLFWCKQCSTSTCSHNYKTFEQQDIRIAGHSKDIRQATVTRTAGV